MQKNRLSDDQLAQSQEPSFLKTLKAKQDAQQKIVEARNAYRQQESAILQGATAQANQIVVDRAPGMSRTHARTGGAVLGGQKGTETRTKKRQREIKRTIDEIYNATAGDVAGTLAKMMKKVTQDFTNSLKNQTDTFNSNVQQSVSTTTTRSARRPNISSSANRKVVVNRRWLHTESDSGRLGLVGVHAQSEGQMD